MYSYEEFIDLQSDGILSHEEKLVKRNLKVMRQCVSKKSKRPSSPPPAVPIAAEPAEEPAAPRKRRNRRR